MAKAKKKSNSVKVDFTDVEARVTLPEGEYKFKPTGVAQEEGSGDYPYLEWELTVQEGKLEGKTTKERTSLSPAALWRLRNLLEAGGVEVPDAEMDIDLDTICDEFSEFVGVIEHEDYEGRAQARLIDVRPVGDEEEPEEEKASAKNKKGKKAEPEAEEKPAAKGKKGKKEPEPEEAPDFDTMDEDELEEFVDEKDLDVDLDDFKKLKDKRTAVRAAFEADDSPEGGGTEYDEDTINEMGTKDLQKVVEDEELDIELDGTTSKKRRAVIKALKAAGKLD